jgi:hypothetical protein
MGLHVALWISVVPHILCIGELTARSSRRRIRSRGKKRPVQLARKNTGFGIAYFFVQNPINPVWSHNTFLSRFSEHEDDQGGR